MLEIKNATKVFLPGTVNEHTALNSLELTVQDGEFITIIGSNGAGKSTLFNAICGEFLLDRGRILLDGEDITFQPVHKRAAHIGRVFQDPMKGTAPNMTIGENLALAYSRKRGGCLRRGIRKGDLDYFRDALRSFDMGLEDRMGTKVGLLSGGQRQALSLLMTTIAKPRLLLLDEHTAALDPVAAEKIMEITKRVVARDNLSTLMITHHIPTALTTGSRFIMLDSGKPLLDLSGEQRDKMELEEIMRLYSSQSPKAPASRQGSEPTPVTTE